MTAAYFFEQCSKGVPENNGSCWKGVNWCKIMAAADFFEQCSKGVPKKMAAAKRG